MITLRIIGPTKQIGRHVDIIYLSMSNYESALKIGGHIKKSGLLVVDVLKDNKFLKQI